MGVVLEVDSLENEDNDHAAVSYRGLCGFLNQSEFIYSNQIISNGPLVRQHVQDDVERTFNQYIVRKEVHVRPLYLIQVVISLLK